MNNPKKHLWEHAAAWALVVSLVLILAAPIPVSAASGICEGAWESCAGEALVASIFSGFQNFLLFMGFCAIGYDWCVKYIS